MKIFYRSSVVWNIILYCYFSVFFLLLQYIYVNISSISNKIVVVGFFTQATNIYYIAVTFITLIAIYSMKKSSLYLFNIHVLYTFVLTGLNLQLEFSKIIIVMTFFYLVIAYYLFQFYKSELSESYYNSNYQKTDLFSPMLKKIQVQILDEEQNELAQGYLTNWSYEGCFIYLDEAAQLKGRVTVSIAFGGKTFSENSTIASKEAGGKGYGFKFQNTAQNQSNRMNWSQFYEIIEQLGYLPELMK